MRTTTVPKFKPSQTNQARSSSPTERERPMAQSFQESLEDFTVDPGGTPFDTKPTLVPPNLEVRVTVVDCRINKWKNDRGENADGTWRAAMNVTLSVDDPEVKEETGLDNPRVVHSVFLDVDKKWDGEGAPPLEQGKGKNDGLGRLLTAFGMNDGRKIRIPAMFMHEQCWARTATPKNEDDRLAVATMLGRDKDAVKGRRKS